MLLGHPADPMSQWPRRPGHSLLTHTPCAYHTPALDMHWAAQLHLALGHSSTSWPSSLSWPWAFCCSPHRGCLGGGHSCLQQDQVASHGLICSRQQGAGCAGLLLPEPLQ